MGYYSTLHYFNFHASMTEEELNNRYKAFVETVKSYDEKFDTDMHYYLEDYSFRKIGENQFEVQLSDYTMKHGADKLLAVFVSAVMDEYVDDQIQEVDIVFYGEEDGGLWGYRVSKRSILILEPVLEPKYTLERVLLDFTGKNIPVKELINSINANEKVDA